MTEPVVSEEIVSLADKLIEQGMQKGLEKGLEKGLRQGRAQTVLKQLRLKFGKVPASAVARVEAASEKDLDRWTERVLTASSLAAVLDG